MDFDEIFDFVSLIIRIHMEGRGGGAEGGSEKQKVDSIISFKKKMIFKVYDK